MTDKQQTFEEAVFNDWKAAFSRDFAVMTPVQKLALKEAQADDDRRNTDTTQVDFERKVSRMSTSEFNKLSTDLAYDAQRAVKK